MPAIEREHSKGPHQKRECEKGVPGYGEGGSPARGGGKGFTSKGGREGDHQRGQEGVKEGRVLTSKGWGRTSQRQGWERRGPTARVGRGGCSRARVGKEGGFQQGFKYKVPLARVGTEKGPQEGCKYREVSPASVGRTRRSPAWVCEDKGVHQQGLGQKWGSPARVRPRPWNAT
jgi:hypothetical protein